MSPTISSLLPVPADGKECGFFSQVRIVTSELQLEAYPWTVLLQYQKPNGGGVGFHCGGVLINNRYVLTAAHCVSGRPIPDNWNLIAVRLGEQNLETDLDCEDSGLPFDFCARSPIDVGIEDTILHEGLGLVGQDIALLRLSKNVTFTNFVQPICLQGKGIHTGDFAEIAGWGAAVGHTELNKKRTTQLKVVGIDECRAAYGKWGDVFHEDQVCASVAGRGDYCGVDSGGVLTKPDKTLPNANHFAVGVMSYGLSPCTSTELPLIATNVQEQLSWIVSMLQP